MVNTGKPAALIAAAVLVAVVGACGSDEEKDKPLRTVRAELILEQFVRPDTGAKELLISLPQGKTRLNRAETTGGAKLVRLRCLDKNGKEAISERTAWPLQEEAGYPYPHIHQLADQRVLNRIRACRLTGPGIDFKGEVPGRPPAASLTR